MSKELEKVKKISDMVLYNADGYASLPNEEVNLLIAIANNAIQRLEAIDNANPSEALEWLNYMESICKEFLARKELYMQFNFTTKRAVETLKEINTIKQALLTHYIVKGGVNYEQERN